jgi:hypothetical protein
MKFSDIVQFLKTNFLNILIVVFMFFTFLTFIQLMHLNFNTTQTDSKVAEDVVLETIKNMNMTPSDAFCQSYLGKSNLLEEGCSRLNKNQCLQTNCCIYTDLFKCSAGTVEGPTYKTNVDGEFISNDYYYYRNKCYGNCPK